MLSVEEARARILAPLRPVPAETVALATAWGRVLAAPVVARLDNPPGAVSAMDGYALRATDGQPGARLRVIGEAPAGHPFAGSVQPGEAVRLYTGSLVPLGADAVLLQEDAAREGDWVEVREAVAAGRHVRPQGQDFALGDPLLAPGRRLSARDVGLAAAANHPWLTVHRRPRVALLATGDEIALPGEPIRAGGIVSSNTHALAALVHAAGGEPLTLPIAADTREALAGAALGAAGADLLVTTGGASVGDYDLVQAALGEHGFALDFWKVAMRPGKPLISGRLGGMPVLGLPGNPVSALVCALLFLWPAIGRLSGLPGDPLPVTEARLGAELPPNDHRADHLRATLSHATDGALVATAFPRQDSAMLRVFANADALILRPPQAPSLAAGRTVPILQLGLLGL